MYFSLINASNPSLFFTFSVKDKKSPIDNLDNITEGENCAYIHIEQSGRRTMRPADCYTRLKYICRFGNNFYL